MGKKVIAVFDIGKTNKKVILFDQQFQIVSQVEQKFPVIHDDDGFECDDIDLITSWITGSLKKITSEGQYELVAVNFCTYGASLMFLNERGE
ncbi:MAG: carbohydrate kinase, partial [Mariniphaga sp.]|nr:carbohydrate kinase [Mariniphaga sp.]